MAVSKLFFGGIPVRPDVERLMKTIKIEPGSIIYHSEIVKVLGGLDPRSSRYRTITTSWRKRIERETFLVLSAEPTVGYLVPTPEQAIPQRRNNLDSASTKVRKATVRIEAIDTTGLSDQLKEEHALLRRHAHMINDTCRQVRKEITAPHPTTSTVRVVK